MPVMSAIEELFGVVLENEPLSLGKVVVYILAAAVLGFLISLCYMFNNRKRGWQQSFILTQIMLPPIIAIIILLVGNSAARALSLAGAFSLIRFRSAAGDPKDISYVFFTLAIGLACGIGYVAYALLFTVLLCAIMIVLENINYAAPKKTNISLKITVPEDLNYQNLYDDILNTYTTRWTLKRVRTSDFGSLFELLYDINIKNDCDQKTFIDLLRQRNGNLPVQLTLREYEEYAAS